MIPSMAFGILLITAVASGAVDLMLWRRRHAGGTTLALLMAAITWWALASALEAGSDSLSTKILWSKFEYLGSSLTAVLYLFFALRRSGWLAPKYSARALSLWLLVAANFGVALTNDWHGLLWTGFTPSPVAANQFIYERGPLFYVLISGIFLYVFAGTALLLQSCVREGLVRKRQNLVVFAASLVPLAAGLVYAAQPAWLGGINITPMGFGIAGMIFAVSVLGLRYFEIAPVARNALFEAMDDGVLVLDADGRMADLNPSAERLLGVTASDIGRPAREILSRWPQLVEEGDVSVPDRFEVQLSQEPLRVVDARMTPVYNKDRIQSGLIIALRDITVRTRALRDLQEAHDRLQDQIDEIRRLQAAVREQAIHDALTGLFNRRYLEETFPRELATARRHRRPLSVILLDVDRFKTINDTLGHLAGDRMLQQLAALLDDITREGDIACRYGGDEFVLVLPDTPLGAALQKAETIRAECQTRCMAAHLEGAPHVTLSLGVASFPDHGQEGSQILVAADRALYRAKEEGRDQVQPGWN